MNSLNPEREVQHTLNILSSDPGLRLNEIHDKLAERSDSEFTHSPSRGNGYNLERYLLKGIIEYLGTKREFISADGRRWSLTESGRQEVS